jgi:hypothetical protein
MNKWNVAAYDESGDPLDTNLSIEEDSPPVLVYAKMGEVFHRDPTNTKKIVVMTEDGEVIREWEEGGAELPGPPLEVTDEPLINDDTKARVKKLKASRTTKKKTKAKDEEPKAKTKKAKPEKTKPVKSTKKKTEPREPRVGVIATVVETISRAQGASIPEIMAVLIKRFPDRAEKGMKATTGIQVSKHCTSKINDDKRGIVYYRKVKK